MSNRTRIVVAVLTVFVLLDVFFLLAVTKNFNVNESFFLHGEFRNSNNNNKDDDKNRELLRLQPQLPPRRAVTTTRRNAPPLDHDETKAPPRRHHHRVAGLSCQPYGGPADEMASSEMVYWKDIPTDARYTSPFANNTGPAHTKYLTFEPDEGGWNNIRMAMETAVLMSIFMGRTLVLPPQHNLYLLWDNGGGNNNKNRRTTTKQQKKGRQKKQFGFEDFFHFDSVTAEHVGLNVISFEEFLQTVAMKGQLIDPATGQSSFPPDNNRTDWNGIVTNFDGAKRGKGKILWNWIRKVIPPLPWDPNKCVAAFGSEPGPQAVDRLNSTMNRVRQRLSAMPNPDRRPRKWKVWVDSYTGHPTAVNASVDDRLAELLAHRDTMCLYDTNLQEQKALHITGDEQTSTRLLVHFYAFLFPENWKHDLWMKRFVRDHIRYHDEIQCAAARVVQAVREISRYNARVVAQGGGGSTRVNGGDGGDDDDGYDSMHIRRGDFQYKDMRLSAEEIYEDNTKNIIRHDRTVFIATDEKNRSWFEPLARHYRLLFLSDFEHLLTGLNTNYYGMVDQLVASRGDVFIGTYCSTFTGYINRMRGYHSQAAAAADNHRKSSSSSPGYDDEGIINSYYYVSKWRPRIRTIMRSYKSVEPGFWQQEFPVAWRDIDHDVIPAAAAAATEEEDAADMNSAIA